jgi:5'(3')-deoxyribonucleotidase
MKRYEQISKKKTIICDVDGVLGDFISYFNDQMKELGYKINKEKSTNWNLKDRFYPIEGRSIEKDYMKILDNVDFWANLPVFKDSQKILKKLNEEYKVLIVTSPFPSVEKNFKIGRLIWLEKHFSFIEKDQIKFESEKWKIPADIIIEDKPETIEKFKGNLKIVMDTDYNKNINADYIRVDNWKEIGEILL